MTAQAGLMLVNSVMPLIAGAVARGAVKFVGSEDIEELTAEGCALAAASLESLEQRGKQVAPNSVAYYAIQSLKSGRRSYGCGRSDVMSPGTLLCGRSRLTSMDEPLSVTDEAEDGELTLHDALASYGEGPDEAAGREIDWGPVYGEINAQQRRVLYDAAAGIGPSETAKNMNVSRPRITQLRRKIADQIGTLWNTDGPIELATSDPAWRLHLTAGRERRACRATRVD